MAFSLPEESSEQSRVRHEDSRGPLKSYRLLAVSSKSQWPDIFGIAIRGKLFLRPTIIKVLDNALTAAELSDVLLAPQALNCIHAGAHEAQPRIRHEHN